MSSAALIRKTRTRAGLTQAELAGRLGLSQAAIARLERPGANPTVQTLTEVMTAMGHRLELAAVEVDSSIDETLIASYLRMSPAERLRAFMSSHDSLARLKTRATRADGPVQG
jgi:transcriptional regulator with XRE-family HTH domain